MHLRINVHNTSDFQAHNAKVRSTKYSTHPLDHKASVIGTHIFYISLIQTYSLTLQVSHTVIGSHATKFLKYVLLIKSTLMSANKHNAMPTFRNVPHGQQYRYPLSPVFVAPSWIIYSSSCNKWTHFLSKTPKLPEIIWSIKNSRNICIKFVYRPQSHVIETSQPRAITWSS
jgi:hypothetical protein